MTTLEPISIATTKALFTRLRALGEVPGRKWPVGEGLTAKLAKPNAPPAAWLKLAHGIHADWLKHQPEVEPELLEAFIECVALAWEDLDDTRRMHSGLYPPLIRALGSAGYADVLAGLVPRVAAFAEDPEAEQALAALLRQLRQHHQTTALHELLDALRSSWRPGLAWGPPLLAGVLALAREATDFSALRSAVGWLPALVEAAEAEGQATEEATWRELGRLALRTLQVPAMQKTVAALLRRERRPVESQTLLLQLLGLLATFAPDAVTRALLEEAAGKLPRHPTVQLGRARIAHAEGAALPLLIELVDDVDPSQPGWAQAMSWLAGTLFHGGEEARALQVYQRLAARDALSSADRLRMNHLHARDEATAESATDEADEAPAPPEHPWSPELLGPFADALAPLTHLLDHAPRHDSAADVAALDAAADAAVAQWREALPGLPDITMQACLQLARHLAQIEAGAFAAHTQWLGAFPFAFTPAYGSVDPQRCAALGRALKRHVVALADFALQRPQPLQGGPGQASVRQALDLAELRCEALWALGEDTTARDSLAALRSTLGGMGDLPLRELQARSLLTTGELEAAASLLAQEGPRDDIEVLQLRPWEAWVAAERLQPQTLVDDATLAGQFESVQPDGQMQQHAHTLAPARFTVVHHLALQVRLGHGLVGPQGGLLQPGAWHLSMGDYPYEHRQVRLRGSARASGAALRPVPTQRVDTPVVVLANLDATYHRNYYHWTLLIASRIEALRARGLLVGGRRLLLPRELSGWMKESLAALGIGEEQMLLYGEDDHLLLSDALLASPLDFASPSLVEGLRQAMWRHAGLDPAAPPEATRLLYISRRAEGRRPLAEEARLQRRAADMGFEVVAPETLTLAEQVRLFAAARGVAGPPGAAYTNLIWAGSGVRVLSIFKEEANLPTFIDLSILRGQSHRWLLGRNLPGYELMSIVNAPFSVDLALAERELAWVAGA
ncbi:MAG: glycosyltransferase 61 family protein [Pseudomonadota bacterium]